MKISMIYIIVIVASSSFFSGCSQTVTEMMNRENLVKKGKIRVEKSSPENISITKVFVYQSKNILEISGKAKLKNKYQSGHFDIAIFDPDKRSLLKTSVDAKRALKRRQSRGTGPGVVTFNENLKFVPPVESIIHVAFHKHEFSDTNTIDCGDNKATYVK